MTVSIFVSDAERKPSQPAPWYRDHTERSIDSVFGSQLEKEEVLDNFLTKAKPAPPPRPQAKPARPAPPAVVNQLKDSSDSEGEYTVCYFY